MKAILFDLDDTLLGNDMDVFLPQYFRLISAFAARWVPESRFVAELLACTREAVADTDPATTNRDVFWRVFKARTGLEPDALIPHFDQFYRDEFDQLRQFTAYRPEAPALVRWCFDHDYKVIIATNPLFPQAAIEARLAWSGVPVSAHDYDLVTTMDNMHATKPNAAYYEEILSRIACSPGEAIMVGDSWENDILPASELGLHTYWIADSLDPEPAEGIVTGKGNLAAFFSACQAGWLNNLDSTL